MRYHTSTNTLFIRGSFRAASTGICGGIRSVPTLLHHTISPGAEPEDPDKVLSRVAAAAGLDMEYSGFLSAIPSCHFCILQYDFITVFISAGIRREPPKGKGGITIIVTSSEGLDDAALVEAIMVATEAKSEALRELDLPISGTPEDGVIVASEGDICHRTAGRLTPAGTRIREAIARGLEEALKRHDTGVSSDRPGFLIFSRFKDAHWIEWVPETCPYYPCHFPGQSCDFCYCPFYPCRNERFGQWVESAKGGRIWNCATCTLLHDPETAGYLKKFPGVSLNELILVSEAKKR
ncbi:cysteine-rich small domain-containing protein [uncultured Methanoregula sp.]|uniref:cysteine-rich small domain-containing protein n=1 Tax=uncultured Methanoregula sp. TaxID=1005933 RepID=UPI002AAB87D3|nr:cysteine-rich small domain-containing protein [uncultured Methanoregula sp.]